MAASLYSLNLANASDAPIPGETAPADPYGALAAAEGSVPLAFPSPSGFLSSTLTVGSLQVPYWAAGLAVLGGLALVGRGRR
jgi:hypothetical protein